MNKTIIYYLAAICPQKHYEILYPNGAISPAYTFNKLLAEGFGAISNSNVEVRCIVPWIVLNQLRGADYPDVEDENGLKYVFLTLEDNKQGYLHFLKAALKEVRKAGKEGKVILVCDALSINFSLLSLLAKIKYGYTNVAIITDFPQYLGSECKSLKSKMLDSVNMWLMRSFDRYILLTRYMQDYINKKGKLKCIMEGICTSDRLTNPTEKYKKKVCLYAGSLQKEYGIGLLTEAFIKAGVPDSELHIYGDGNYREQLERICSAHDNIIYCGVRPKDIVVEEERKATLLINPRTSEGEFTKYSFPSKTLEYMTTGTPLVMVKLPGLPEEYCDYLYLFEEETADGYASTLRTLLNKSDEELEAMGRSAQNFVLQNKNNIVQAEKIIKELKLLS